jgi:hypothetical protein
MDQDEVRHEIIIVEDKRMRSLKLLASRWSQRLRWLYRQRVKGFSVPDNPHFDGDLDTTNCFLERLPLCRMYLEYGSGGSTVTAARTKKPFITVDGDRFYLTSVQKKIEQQFGSVPGIFLYADIGLTGEWSFPTFTSATTRRLKKWKCYPEAPWNIIKERSQFPDLILIDGRFRVACALVSLKHLNKQSDFVLLIDDYAERPHYRVVEDFAHLDLMKGRMAVFKPKLIDPTKIAAAIEAATSDYR